jgi:short-subunit dehydrogenase
VVLVGRDPSKLAQAQADVQARAGGSVVAVVGDLSDITSARRAAREIIGMELPIAGLLNNAGIMPMTAGLGVRETRGYRDDPGFCAPLAG